MKQCNLLSEKDNAVRKSYESPSFGLWTMETDDVIRTSPPAVEGDENGYTWGGSGWSDVLTGKIFSEGEV